MSAEHRDPESLGFSDQLPDRYHPVAADMSSFGMGSFQDFDRYLVRPLQSRFQARVHRDADSGDDLTPAGKLVLHHTLHGQLLQHVLALADTIGFGIVQSRRLTNSINLAYRKHFARILGWPMDNQ